MSLKYKRFQLCCDRQALVHADNYVFLSLLQCIGFGIYMNVLKLCWLTLAFESMLHWCTHCCFVPLFRVQWKVDGHDFAYTSHHDAAMVLKTSGQKVDMVVVFRPQGRTDLITALGVSCFRPNQCWATGCPEESNSSSSIFSSSVVGACTAAVCVLARAAWISQHCIFWMCLSWLKLFRKLWCCLCSWQNMASLRRSCRHSVHSPIPTLELSRQPWRRACMFGRVSFCPVWFNNPHWFWCLCLWLSVIVSWLHLTCQ